MARVLGILLLLWHLSACHSQPGETTPPSDEGLVISDSGAVIVFEASLRKGPGTGPTLGRLLPNTVVRLGQKQGQWTQVQVSAPLPAQGWVRTARIGCRALHRVELQRPTSEGPPVTLQPGALLAIQSRQGPNLAVVTQDTITARGTVPASACGVGEAFVPELPRDGHLHIIGHETSIMSNESSQRPLGSLPEGYRFVAIRRQGRSILGRTDGPVVVEGLVDRRALEPDPRSTPLDRLAEPLGYTHELIVDEPLFDEPEGQAVLNLPGGTAINIVTRQGDWSEVRTVGRAELQGWVPHTRIRRVSLDHNDLDPEARRRDHFPVNRNEIRGDAEPE